MLRTSSNIVNSPKVLHQLFVHECTREMADRLNCQEDLLWFTTCALSGIGKNDDEFQSDQKVCCIQYDDSFDVQCHGVSSNEIYHYSHQFTPGIRTLNQWMGGYCAKVPSLLSVP